MVPWSELMKFGFGYLKLSPDAFWKMTLRELDSAIEWSFPSLQGHSVPNAENLRELISIYPDN